jgi:hypothetical protein
MTLIDSPRLPLSKEMIDWLFMFSAFLGIPVSIPLFAAFVLAWHSNMQGKDVELSKLALVMLGTFGLGCAVSNMHDVLWCGIITDGYSKHYSAGYDLDVFVAVGGLFGIPREILADYTTLGPCAMVLILGELLVSVVCGLRLRKLHAA